MKYLLIYALCSFIHRAAETSFINTMTTSCYEQSRISVIAFDFDKTCTKDSVLDIYKARKDYKTGNDLERDLLDAEWTKLTDFYLKIAGDVSLPKIDETKMSSVFDPEGLRVYLQTWGEVDTIASKEVIKSGILKGITSSDLKEFAKDVELRPSLLKVLDYLKILNLPLHIMSLNFSEKLITEVLDRNDSKLPLITHANQLLFDANGVSSGVMRENFLTAFDKETMFKKLVENSKETCGITVYIGDSYNDLLVLLQADVGFIIGDSTSMVHICQYYGIDVTRYHYETVMKKLNNQQSKPQLFSIKSWNEVQEFIQHIKS